MSGKDEKKIAFAMGCAIINLKKSINPSTFETAIKTSAIITIKITHILILWIITRITIAKEANKEPEFIKYTQDELLGYVWEWTWGKNYNGQYEIRDLQPICSKCETPLFSEVFNRPFLKCVRCGEMLDWDVRKLDQVKVLIYDNVRKGQYKI